jgi:hypothetical protein
MKTTRLNFTLALIASLLAAPLSAFAHNGVVHGDHDAHHGGFVMMYRDLHCEVVLKAGGEVQLYYTDAMRADLPASVVSQVAVEIEKSPGKSETVAMGLSAGGDYWEGKAKTPVTAASMLHVAFVFQAEPVVVNLPANTLLMPKPAAVKPASAAKPDHDMAGMSGMDHHAH